MGRGDPRCFPASNRSRYRTLPGPAHRHGDDAHRTLPKPAHLVSYAGLAPRTSQSGLRPIRHGSIPAGANRWLRGAFGCAVVTHIAHAPDSWLSHAYEQTRKRLGWQVARVATARRLARAVHAMLRTGEVWHGESTTYRGKSELQETHVALTTPRFD